MKRWAIRIAAVVVVLLVAAGVAVRVGISRYDPLELGSVAGNPDELTVEGSRLFGEGYVVDFGERSEVTVMDSIRNTGRWPVRISGVAAATTTGYLGLESARYIADPFEQGMVGDEEDARRFGSFMLGRGEEAVLLLSFRTASPCISMTAGSHSVTDTLTVRYEVLGVAREQRLELHLPLAIRFTKEVRGRDCPPPPGVP